MTPEASRVQRLSFVAFVAISSLVFERVAPRTDMKVCAGSPKKNIIRSCGGIAAGTIPVRRQDLSCCTIDDTLGPPVFGDQRRGSPCQTSSKGACHESPDGSNLPRQARRHRPQDRVLAGGWLRLIMSLRTVARRSLWPPPRAVVRRSIPRAKIRASRRTSPVASKRTRTRRASSTRRCASTV